MKTLKDLCLDFLAINLNGNISCITRDMATIHKELLLERLVNHDRLTAEYLPHVTYNLFAPSLKRVVFYRCEQVTDDMLLVLSRSGCQLTKLTINGCKSVTDAGIVNITKDQPDLEVVELKNLPNLTAKGLRALQTKGLEVLDFKKSGITSDAVELVLRNNGTVRQLVLSFCMKLDEKVFTYIAQRLGSKLEILDVSNVYCLSDDCIIQLATYCPNITKLHIYGCNRITDIGLSEVCSRCTNMSDLDLSFCMQLRKSDCLCCLPVQLRELCLSGIQLADEADLLKAMQRLTSLRGVRLCGIPALTDSSLDVILQSIGKKLELLDISAKCSLLSERALTSIVCYCPNLTDLYLSMLERITGLALIPLLQDSERAERLSVLHISCRMLDAEVLQYIADNCHNLEELVVSGVSVVNDEFLLSVANHCPRLRYIGLKGCRQVTDVGVCALGQCTNLRCVVLSGINQLTDRSVLRLANSCPYIDEFYASGCNMVTQAALRYLVDSCIPRVFWEHRVPNLDPEMLMAHNLDTRTFCRVDVASAN